MKRHHLGVLGSGIFATAALALAVGVGAQTPPPAAATPAAKSPHAGPMAGHHKDSAAAPKHEADRKAGHEAMLAKRQEMLAKLDAMDAKLDKLVADMSAALGSKDRDALEKPMAAVINELVAQQKAHRAMMTEMRPAMAEHMEHHHDMHGAEGAVEHPMMKTDKAPGPKREESKPRM